jgi:2-polyprenyl-3-methyl-5-hydroxy-6-metoxy-1,4-benzoquinol methylase
MNEKEKPFGSSLKYTAHQFKKVIKPSELENYELNAAIKSHELWQRDSLVIELYSPKVAYQKLAYIHTYIHLNPMANKWNLVSDRIKYHYSSARFYNRGNSPF